MDLSESILKGDRRALARMITLLENQMPEAEQWLRDLYPHSGQAYTIGITGPPGAGKSTLTDKLVKLARRSGQQVAVIAVDPTSPFSGGAILGDRVRMGDLSTDPGVFIRSMGSRGHLGGISEATSTAASVLDAAGYGVIFIETVGVGQSEVDIAAHCDTTLLVTVPGLGDEIQALKAGILEIGDVFAVNKADLDGADKTALELEGMLDYSQKPWRASVHKIIARESKGTDLLWQGIEEHRSWQIESGALQERRRANCRTDLLERVQNRLIKQMHTEKVLEKQLAAAVDAICNRTMDPYTASEQVLETFKTYDRGWSAAGEYKESL